MAVPRLGAASVTVSISDAEGFQVVRSDGSVLRHVPADRLIHGAWKTFWAGIEAVEHNAAMRATQVA